MGCSDYKKLKIIEKCAYNTCGCNAKSNCEFFLPEIIKKNLPEPPAEIVFVF